MSGLVTPIRRSPWDCHPLSGRPKGPFRRALMARIKEKGGFAPIYERIAQGETLTAIGKDYTVSRDYLRVVLVETEQRAKLFHDARRDSAYAHAEKGLEIIDAAGVDRDAINLAKERANYRKWLASKLDRETFGDAPLVQLNDNRVQSFSQQYLDALRAPRASLPSGPALLPASDAEIVPEVSHVEGKAVGDRVAGQEELPVQVQQG